MEPSPADLAQWVELAFNVIYAVLGVGVLWVMYLNRERKLDTKRVEDKHDALAKSVQDNYHRKEDLNQLMDAKIDPLTDAVAEVKSLVLTLLRKS
jgi:hypothetical protein